MKLAWSAVLASMLMINIVWAQTDAEMEKLKKDAAREQEEEMKGLPKRVSDLEKKVSGGAVGDKSSFRVFWKDGLNMETADKMFKFNVSGRVHLDWGYADNDDDFQRRFARDHSYEEGWFFRRARLQMGGTMWQSVFYKAEFDFSGNAGTITFTDVFMGVADVPLHEHFSPTLTLGHFKEPFSIEELTSSRFITFTERSLLNNAFTPARNTGFMINDSIVTDRITWAMGAFKDVGASGNSQGTAQDGRYAFTVRLTGLPWFERDGKELVHLGAAIRSSLPGAAVQFTARPESRVSTANPTGAVPAAAFPVKDVDNLLLYGFEIAAIYGPFWLQGEYMMVTVDHETSLNPTFSGFYISAGFFFTGESRNYKKSSGAFDRQKVNSPLFDGKGGFGAVELAVRISWLDLSDDGLSGDEHRGITIALNWYLNPNTRVMIDYVMYNVFGPDTAALPDAQVNIIAVRFSVDW